MTTAPGATPALASGRRVHSLSIAVLLVWTALVIAGVAITWASHVQTEQRLLDQQTAEAAALMTTAIAGVQTPLAAAAELAEVTDGAREPFEAVMSRSVLDQQFTSAALFAVSSDEPLVEIGEPALLVAAGPARIRAMIEQAMASEALAVIDTLDLPGRRLGYAFTSQQAPTEFVVYAESALPAERTAVPRDAGPFARLDYALYIAPGERIDDLLYSSRADLPITGRRSSAVASFGDRQLVLVTSSATERDSTISRVLPWLIAVGGTLLAVVWTVATERLLRRRHHAEQLAADVSRLSEDHRRRSETLQRSLIPAALLAPPGASVAGRYWPSDPDAEVGGDFYDLFEIDDGRWGVAIGDVCGRGIEAAALTGLTRHTLRAAARHLRSPADVLRWTHEAIEASSGQTYCTVCFGFLTTSNGTGIGLELALGGHPQPVLGHADGTAELVGEPGTVLGMIEPRLHAVSHQLVVGDRLVFYTDGITDAPGDRAVTVEQLQHLVADGPLRSPDELAEEIRAAIETRRPAGSRDDTALLILQVNGSSGG